MMDREYHWIMTVQWPIGAGGFATGTSWGVITVPQSSTRAALFDRAFQHIVEQGAPDNASVLFFAVEPNELPQ